MEWKYLKNVQYVHVQTYILNIREVLHFLSHIVLFMQPNFAHFIECFHLKKGVITTHALDSKRAIISNTHFQILNSLDAPVDELPKSWVIIQAALGMNGNNVFFNNVLF